MPIKNSISVLFCNFKLVAKFLLFIFIIVLIVSAILIGLVNPIIEGFFKEIQKDLDVDKDEFVDELVTHPILTIKDLVTNKFINYIKANSALVVQKSLFMWLSFIVAMFCAALPLLPITKILHGKMATGCEMKVLSAFIVTLPQNLLFSLFYAVIWGTLDILIFIGTAFMFTWLIKMTGLIGMPFALLVSAAAFTAKSVVLCQWLPEICRSDDKNIFKALAASFKPAFKNFRKNFLCLFSCIIVMASVFLSTIIPTLGLMPILLIPTAMVFFCALNLALNFSFYKQKYFTDNGATIYSPIKKY